MLGNTVVQDASARDSLNTFLGGQGDVIISYENEVIGAQQAGEELDLVVPDDTIKIETIAVTTEETRRDRAGVPRLPLQRGGPDAVRRERLPPGRREGAGAVRGRVPEPPGLFDIESLGGWETVATEFFDPENGKVADIEAELGVATE